MGGVERIYRGKREISCADAVVCAAGVHGARQFIQRQMPRIQRQVRSEGISKSWTGTMNEVSSEQIDISSA